MWISTSFTSSGCYFSQRGRPLFFDSTADASGFVAISSSRIFLSLCRFLCDQIGPSLLVFNCCSYTFNSLRSLMSFSGSSSDAIAWDFLLSKKSISDFMEKMLNCNLSWIGVAAGFVALVLVADTLSSWELLSGTGGGCFLLLGVSSGTGGRIFVVFNGADGGCFWLRKASPILI